MSWIALKMLTGNRGKYLGIILGIAFASLLIAQQASIFCGLMLQTSGQIRDIQGASIWVMDPNVQFSDDIKPLSENDLYRVRGVEGVSWAVRLYKGLTRSRLADGNFQQTILLGLDDATLVGAPPKMILGNLFDLRKPDAVIMDLEGYQATLAGRGTADRQAVRDERPRGRDRGHLQSEPHVSDVSRCVHALLAGARVRAAGAESACRSCWPR